MRLVRGTALVFTLASLALTATACEEEPMGPQISDLAGTWDGTKFQYTNKNDASIAVPIIQIGGSLVVTVDDAGAFTGELKIPDQSSGGVITIPLAGTISLTGDDQLFVDFTDAVNTQAGFEDLTVTYTLSGNTLTWKATDVVFDFNQDGEETSPQEDAILDVVLERR